ncbi:glycosyltransferase family 2 protein [Chthonobacter rhizosphaerae]|uniref:glycosyltransferase family 2 protein n=1 Tax=Chthonobacter rhizosphaerae TaxID=2735553 RepID=UPI0015EF40CB|nr:glycosyltransferase [Chthonobacter rhizosphaerae]
MKIGVIIPSLARSQQLIRLLAHLERQVRRPDEVIVSLPSGTDIAAPEHLSYPVTVLNGPKGSSAQRNTALDHAAGRFDVLAFLDDDFIPSADYLQGLEAAFSEHDDWAVVMGRVLLDGATGEGLSWADAMAALADAASEPPPALKVVEHVGAYGCNMSVRARAVGSVRFDERLVLYGWQEDIDFTSQLRPSGRIVSINTISGVHLGLKSGKVRGEQFGYSQIANPVYLVRKGTVPLGFALRLMSRNVAANLVRSLRPEPYVDRRGRLRGNALAMLHVVTGRVEPEYILKI